MPVKIAARFRRVKGTIYWGRGGNYSPKRWIRDDGKYQNCTLKQFLRDNDLKCVCEDLDPKLPYATVEDMGDSFTLPAVVAVFVPRRANIVKAWGVPLP
jgi:hypothetical protein